MRQRRFPLALLLAACACLAVAYANRDVYPSSTVVFDGKQLASGWTAYAPLDDTAVSGGGPNRFEDFVLWDPLLWTGAALALLIVALCVLAASRRRARA